METKDNVELAPMGKEESSFKETETPSVTPLGFFKLFRYCTNSDIALLIVGGIAAAGTGATLPLFSVILGDLFDALGTDDTSKAKEVALIFLWVGIGAFFSGWLQMSSWKYVSLKTSNIIRKSYLDAVLRKNITWFDTHNVSEISAGMDADCMLIQEGMGEKVALTIQFATMFFVGLIIGFVKGWQLTLVILAMFPLLGLAGAMVGMLFSGFATKSQEAYAKAGAIADEVFTSIRTVASFNAQKREADRYNSHIENARSLSLKSGLLSGVSIASVMFVMLLSYGVSLWYGAKLIVDGVVNTYTGNVYTGGDVIGVFFSVLIGSFAVGQISPNIPTIMSAKIAAAKVFAIIDDAESSEVVENTKEQNNTPIKGNIRFENVTFAYPTRTETNVVSDFSISIKSGETIALVGESGSGKSTAIGLLERFYNPASGKILIDDVEIDQFDLGWLRKNIALVSQEPVLLQGTILDNIVFGNPGASMDEVIAASKSANAHQFINALPNKYETKIGGNTSLSGGQKQRIAIARAIIKQPRILLLDEATSALDNQSEAVVQAALDEIMKNHTTIVVAHRLSTIRNVDCIYVMSKGRVFESGTHDELMEKRGLYMTLVQGQAQSSKDSSGPTLESEARRSSVASGTDANVEIEEADEEEDIAKKYAKSVSARDILELVRDHWGMLAMGVICAAIHGFVFPSFSILLSNMVELYYQDDTSEIEDDSLVYMFIFFGIGTAILVFASLQAYNISTVGCMLTYRLRSMAFEKILRQEVSWFDLPENRPGILTTRLASDAQHVKSLMVDRLGLLVQTAAMVAFGLGVGFYYGWQLTLAILVIAPLLGVSSVLDMKMFGQDKTQKALFEDINSMALESITNIRTIKSFTYEDGLMGKFALKMESPPMKKAYTKSYYHGLGMGFSNFIQFSVYTMAFSIGAYMVEQGWMTFGEVLQVFFGIVMAFSSVGGVVAFLPDVTTTQLAANAIFEVLNLESKSDPWDTTGSKVALKGDPIVFKDVVFRYPSRLEVKVFDKLSFQVAPGTTFALVGPSGGGKSSVIALLERFYSNEAGQISIGATSLDGINLAHLRDEIGLVSQEPELFNSSIRENLLYGKTDASDTDIEEALRSANALDFVNALPEKQETVIGPRGILLSGGQRQRIAIARAILKNPKILLLDEATSALDNESERLVQEALNRLMEGRTTIVIAHRLSTIANATTIAVMESGRIVEMGNHDQLVAQDGFYANLLRVGGGLHDK